MMSNYKDYSLTQADVALLLGAWSFLENPPIQPANQGTVQLYRNILQQWE
jgi:hypothetical protein